MRVEKSTIRVRADAVRGIATRRNQTLHALATKCGISERHLYCLLSGGASPRPGLRARILRALDARFDDIFEIAPEREAV